MEDGAGCAGLRRGGVRPKDTNGDGGESTGRRKVLEGGPPGGWLYLESGCTWRVSPHGGRVQEM